MNSAKAAIRHPIENVVEYRMGRQNRIPHGKNHPCSSTSSFVIYQYVRRFTECSRWEAGAMGLDK